MIHRRLLQDDGLGGIGRHQLLISNNKKKNNIQGLTAKFGEENRP